MPVEFEEWGPWTECSTTCGGGKQARQRTCKIPEGADAVNCVGVLKEVRECNNNPCPGELSHKYVLLYLFKNLSLFAVNCKWEWGEYESCTKPCGGGEKSRFPIITQHSQHAGQPCPPNVRNNVPDTTSCNTQPCSREYIIFHYLIIPSMTSFVIMILFRSLHMEAMERMECMFKDLWRWYQDPYSWKE